MRYSIILVFCTFVLTGCTASLFQNEIFEGEKINVTEISYSAADMLVQQTKAFVTTDTVLQIGLLTDMHFPEKPTALGRIIPSHIGARFVQLGYNVTASSFQAMTGAPQEGLLSGGSAAEISASGYSMRSRNIVAEQALITGHYVVARREVLVSLRIIEVASGRVLAAYDYSLPLSGDVRSLIRTDDEDSAFFGLL